jgi:DNA-directed RNA polymerase subunit H (RpoH/RPB5)
MMATLINNDDSHESYIVIVIQPDNLARMQKSDPITLESEALGGLLPEVKYPARLALMIAYEEDEVALYKAAQTGDFGDILRLLRRGYKFNRDVDGTHRAFSINAGREAENK